MTTAVPLRRVLRRQDVHLTSDGKRTLCGLQCIFAFRADGRLVTCEKCLAKETKR